MAKLLAISSQVASGHVGLSAIVPTLQALGHEVIALPTVLLANHPGKQPTSGMRIEPDVLDRMLDTLSANGRLDGLDGVLSGYLPSAAHVAFANRAVVRCRELSPGLSYLCDPVLGDDPKGLYIDIAAAEAVRGVLMPLADIITPNRFELAWLTGCDVTGVDSAKAAAAQLSRVPMIVATSIPAGADHLATLAIAGDEMSAATVPRRAAAPNGTGDLLSALILAAAFDGTLPDAHAKLRWAIDFVDHVLADSNQQPDMMLIGSMRRWLAKRGEST